jgi:hypothetical protein
MDVGNIANITIFSSWKPPYEQSADELEGIKRGDGADWLHNELRRNRENRTRFVFEPPLASALLGGRHSIGADFVDRPPSDINLSSNLSLSNLSPNLSPGKAWKPRV